MILFLAAQLADAVTYSPETEINGLVLSLGDAAYLAKALLVLAVVCVAVALRQGRYAWVRPIVLGIGAGVGFVGAASNIA